MYNRTAQTSRENHVPGSFRMTSPSSADGADSAECLTQTCVNKQRSRFRPVKGMESHSARLLCLAVYCTNHGDLRPYTPPTQLKYWRCYVKTWFQSYCNLQKKEFHTFLHDERSPQQLITVHIAACDLVSCNSYRHCGEQREDP